MAHGTFKVLDSDIHIIEPPDLWPRYIDPAFRDRAPHGLTEDAGDLRLALGGHAWGRAAVDADRQPAPSGTQPRPQSGTLAALRGTRMDVQGPARGDGHRGHRRGRGLSLAGSLRPDDSRHGPAPRRGHGARVQRLAPRVLPGEPGALARRRHDLPVRRQRCRGGGAAMRQAARLPGHVPAAERGQRAELA